MIEIAHVLPSVLREAGGPSLSVRRLVQTLDAEAPDFRCAVFSGDAATSPEWEGMRVQTFRTVGPRRVAWAPELRVALANSPAKLLHLHSLWGAHAWTSSRVVRQRCLPLVVSPRGMLEPWALRQGRLQKWLANRLFQRGMLRRAACVVTTSEMEAKGVRLAGYGRTPIAIIPNGVDPVPPESWAFSPAAVARMPRTALFLSRLTPKKGIVELLRAWKRLSPVGWRLRIVGPSERGYAEVVAAAIAQEGLGASVELSGPIWGEEKRQAFFGAQLFVLPSYSENFGLVIGEALAAGLPVITTRATPWQELETERCGWWIDVGEEALVSALREALACSVERGREMGALGRNLIERRYAWPVIGREMAALYRRILQDRNHGR